MSRIALLVACSIIGLGAELPAQQGAQELRRGARLRLTVWSPEGYLRQAVGGLTAADDDSVVLVNGSGRLGVPRQSISRVERSRGWGTGQGALIGAAVIGTPGLMLGLSMTGPCEGWFDLFCGATSADVAQITLVSAAAGAAIGALIGSMSGERWRVESVDRIRVIGGVRRSGGAVSVSVQF